MITLTKSGNAIVFEFDDNSHYLNDGTIEVPVNSLTLVTDDSQMATFRKSASNDIFISATYDELGMSKADLETFYKENMVGSTGGGGVTPEEVQDMIDESISGKADTSDVQEIASDVTTVSGDVNTLSGSVNALTGAVNTISGDVSTLSGAVDSNHNAITALNGDVQTLSGQVETDEKVTANALVDLDNRKLDASAYTPTDLSNYYTKSQTNTQINNATSGLVETSAYTAYTAATDARLAEDEEVTSAALNELNDALDGKADLEDIPTNVSELVNDAGYATSGYVDSSVSGKMDTSTFNTYSASTDNRLSEDEEVTAAALNSLNSNKQDKLTAGSGITINNNVISCTVSGGSTYSAGRGIDITNDIISFNLPISAGTGINSVKESNKNNNASGDYSHAEGIGTNAGGVYSHAEGQSTIAGGNSSHAEGSVTLASGLAAHAEGYHTEAKNTGEHASGFYNVSKTGLTVDNKTLFSVGNGTDDARHNAFEIRQNGDIYITKDGSDVKLQDQLGGGGVPESAFTAYTAATDARLAEDEEVTAAALNTLSTNMGGLKLVQLTQAQYDNLATKDASTLYIITGSN